MKGTLPAGPAVTGLDADNHLKKDDLGVILQSTAWGCTVAARVMSV